ncbi:hypothetical protein FRB99_008583, partial [Tulasnella sp. 403]
MNGVNGIHSSLKAVVSNGYSDPAVEKVAVIGSGNWQFLAGVLKRMKGKVEPGAKAVTLIKGVQVHDNHISTFASVISQELNIPCSALSGANIANEVAADKYSESTLGIPSHPGEERADLEARPEALLWKSLFQTPTFRIQVVDDVEGVSLCGALKNVVAIAAGFVDGLGWGDNSKAAIMRIGMMEIHDFCLEFFPGTKSSTFLQESCGVADIMTSCMGGRNRRIAVEMVKSRKSFEQLEKELLNGQKLQGPYTALEIHEFLTAHGVDNIKRAKKYPLFKNVWKICFEEDVLSELLKKSAGGGLLGLGGGSKFGGLDVKRVYFGNWLRDYSQAVDITGLKSVQLQTILNIVTVLGFLAHGYATGPFEVTAERLGTYLPVEHIDNPKGYGEGEDPRKYHPKLRPPVHPQEYAVDPNTGMKNYIANESGFWDTSKAHVRRTLEQCIHYGRQYRQSKNQDDKFEAYRLLGSALHTLEDFFAHSNFCELTLISIGGWNVFPHVGDRTKIRAPNGQYVYPLVTGTFGGSDFIHSVLGEATDHLSQSSLTELNSEMTTANKKKTSGNVGSVASIKDLSSKIPGLSSGSDMDRDIQNMERSRAGTQGKNPNEMNPQEIRNAIWPVLVFRDNLVLKIETVIEKIPGLQAILDSLIESIQVFVLTTIEPFVRPLIEAATGHLMENSAAVINSHDQYEVFSNPNASDPTHSFLSKDHFNTILNEPAGNLAKLVV